MCGVLPARVPVFRYYAVQLQSLALSVLRDLSKPVILVSVCIVALHCDADVKSLSGNLAISIQLGVAPECLFASFSSIAFTFFHVHLVLSPTLPLPIGFREWPTDSKILQTFLSNPLILLLIFLLRLNT